MNRNYRSYCRRMGEAMFLRHIFPRSTLNDDELIRIYQTAQTTDLDLLRQTAEEMYPEHFQSTHQHGAPTKPSFGFVGRGEAREQTLFSPQAETELIGLCPDDGMVQSY